MTTDRDTRVRETLREFIDYGYSREKAVALLAELDASADKPVVCECGLIDPAQCVRTGCKFPL
jgi:hypothetical protein